jgi:putative Mn2+ efflux pump MntP
MAISGSDFLKIVVLCVASSLDNFAVGLSYAINKKRISYMWNAFIASLNGLTTMGTMLLSSYISTSVEDYVAEMIGACIFLFLGSVELFRFAYPSSARRARRLWYELRGRYRTSSDWTTVKESVYSSQDITLFPSPGESREGHSDGGLGVYEPLSLSDALLDHDSAMNSVPVGGVGALVVRKNSGGEIVVPSPRESSSGSSSPVTGIAALLSKDGLPVGSTFDSTDDDIIRSSYEDILTNDAPPVDPEDGFSQKHIHHVLETQVEFKEAIVLAVGLCFTNVAGGIGAGFAGFDIALTSIGGFICSFVMLLFGQGLGNVFGQIVPEAYISLLSGLLLIAVGIVNLPFLGLVEDEHPI